MLASVAIRPDMGGYSEVVITAPENSDTVTHETMEDWLGQDLQLLVKK